MNGGATILEAKGVIEKIKALSRKSRYVISMTRAETLYSIEKDEDDDAESDI